MPCIKSTKYLGVQAGWKLLALPVAYVGGMAKSSKPSLLCATFGWGHEQLRYRQSACGRSHFIHFIRFHPRPQVHQDQVRETVWIAISSGAAYVVLELPRTYHTKHINVQEIHDMA